jgi:hypothetical protein
MGTDRDRDRQSTGQRDQHEDKHDDTHQYIDRSKIDFDPDDGLYTGTAVEGTSEIPGPHEQDDNDNDKNDDDTEEAEDQDTGQ